MLGEGNPRIRLLLGRNPRELTQMEFDCSSFFSPSHQCITPISQQFAASGWQKSYTQYTLSCLKGCSHITILRLYPGESFHQGKRWMSTLSKFGMSPGQNDVGEYEVARPCLKAQSLQVGTDLIEKKFDMRLEEDLDNYWNRLDYVSLVA
jgi:hypothetical protein